MKRFLLILIALLLVPSAVPGQHQHNQRLVISLPQGGFAAFQVEATPLDQNQADRQSTNGFSLPITPRVVREGSVVHRLLVDDQGRLVFVYDLIITELDSPKSFKVSARPATPGFERRLRIQNPGAFQGVSESRIAPPTFTSASQQQDIDDGETFALDLLVNEPLGVKVVDYVTVASQRWLLSPQHERQPPRDFGLSNVELAVQSYELRVDGLPIVSSSNRRNCAGALIWFSLPGQGRFIFSLVPYAGYDFHKVGVIEDNTIAFTWKGIEHEWISREPIVAGGGAWNVWVMHDAGYADLFVPGKPDKLPRMGTRPVTVYPDSVGVTIPPRRKSGKNAWGLKDIMKSEPVWISIGGAKSIKELLPKK